MVVEGNHLQVIVVVVMVVEVGTEAAASVFHAILSIEVHMRLGDLLESCTQNSVHCLYIVYALLFRYLYMVLSMLLILVCSYSSWASKFCFLARFKGTRMCYIQ